MVKQLQGLNIHTKDKDFERNTFNVLNTLLNSTKYMKDIKVKILKNKEKAHEFRESLNFNNTSLHTNRLMIIYEHPPDYFEYQTFLVDMFQNNKIKIYCMALDHKHTDLQTKNFYKDTNSLILRSFLFIELEKRVHLRDSNKFNLIKNNRKNLAFVFSCSKTLFYDLLDVCKNRKEEELSNFYRIEYFHTKEKRQTPDQAILNFCQSHPHIYDTKQVFQDLNVFMCTPQNQHIFEDLLLKKRRNKKDFFDLITDISKSKLLNLNETSYKNKEILTDFLFESDRTKNKLIIGVNEDLTTLLTLIASILISNNETYELLRQGDYKKASIEEFDRFILPEYQGKKWQKESIVLYANKEGKLIIITTLLNLTKTESHLFENTEELNLFTETETEINLNVKTRTRTSLVSSSKSLKNKKDFKEVENFKKIEREDNLFLPPIYRRNFIFINVYVSNRKKFIQ